MTWTNRIIEYSNVSPRELRANPLNARVHPPSQRAALESVLDTIGMVQQVIVNRRTGLIVDGHLRVQMAADAGLASIPVAYVDLTESEEEAVLATFDPMGALAQVSKPKLDAAVARAFALMPAAFQTQKILTDALARMPIAEELEGIADRNGNETLHIPGRALGETPAEALERYNTTDVRRVVLHVLNSEHELISVQLARLTKARGLDRPAQLVYALFEESHAALNTPTSTT